MVSIRLTPFSCMVTPYSTSASSMVPRRWVMTINCVFSEYHTVVDGVAVDYTYTDTITDSVRTQYSYILSLTKVQK